MVARSFIVGFLPVPPAFPALGNKERTAYHPVGKSENPNVLKTKKTVSETIRNMRCPLKMTVLGPLGQFSLSLASSMRHNTLTLCCCLFFQTDQNQPSLCLSIAFTSIILLLSPRKKKTCLITIPFFLVSSSKIDHMFKCVSAVFFTITRCPFFLLL